MGRINVGRATFLIFAFALLAPAAWTQQSASGIARAVKDAMGVAVAGVNVEASSDALIEKVRTVVTDSQGQYKIVNLVPGTFVVTFKAPGSSCQGI